MLIYGLYSNKIKVQIKPGSDNSRALQKKLLEYTGDSRAEYDVALSEIVCIADI